MLAALLLNLESGPTPPPAAQPFFSQGGGPFTRRYGYDPKYYSQEFSEPEVEILEAAVTQAVKAILTQPKPTPIVLDARRIYERVFKEVHGIERQRARELWREAVQRRIQQEDEEIVCLMFL